jgi:hypothetical protein
MIPGIDFIDSILYWKLKEFEEIKWSGSIYFMDSKSVIGILFLNNGYISWAQAKGQKETLFSAMQHLAQIDRDDILFADSVYKEQASETNFVSVLEESGLISFWTLRECMRVQIFNALSLVGSIPDLEFKENSSKIAKASEHKFTIDELSYSSNIFDKNIGQMALLGDIGSIEVHTREKGVVIRWSEKETEDKLFPSLALIHQNNMKNFDDYAPDVTTYKYPHGSYAVKSLSDIFETTIMVFVKEGSSICEIADFIAKYPTIIIMQIADSTIPIVSMT